MALAKPHPFLPLFSVKVGFSTYFITPKNVLFLIERALQKGIRFFEIAFEIPQRLNIDSGFLKEIKNLQKEGASFSLHGPWIECNLGSIFEEIRNFAKSRIFESIKIAHEWGLNPLILHPGYNFFKDEEIKELSYQFFLNELREIESFAKEKNIEVLIENVPFTFSFFNGMEDSKVILKTVPVRICYDVGHSFISKVQKGIPSPEDAIIREILENKDHIAQIHLHGNEGRTDSHLLYESRLDLRRILKELERNTFLGRIVVESEDIETYGVEYFTNWLDSK
ncbi:MAG: sugar phosphate isomerase/epimerase [Desulfobacterota bacterium]|nr:sugar phosphate isomerase/epimerase [Thermodesulfobacteriota bacterium]MDW8002013.1 sugar phosphate isomerase/epimerase family protein [Deltaproteobacteria bacterium]